MPETRSRTLAIGDIHGCLAALLALEKLVKFTPEDKIILLGDYVDRGANSREVIDWILERRETLNITTLLGNHEVMMENASVNIQDHHFWTMNGGYSTLMSFESELDDVPEKYWDFFDDCKLYHETDDFIFVHAGPAPEIPLSEQEIDTLCWLRFPGLKPHQSGKIVICGHTPQKTYDPNVQPHAICIDTHAFHKAGLLTCLDVNSGDYWQASNHTPETRSDTLEMPTKSSVKK